jgi:hypothetical protein
MKKILALIATVAFLVSYSIPIMEYSGSQLILMSTLIKAFQSNIFALDITAFFLAFILAVIGLIVQLVDKGTWMIFSAGLIGLIGCIIEFFTFDSQMKRISMDITIMQVLTFGFWLLLASSIAMMISHFLKKPEPGPQFSPPPAQNFQ